MDTTERLQILRRKGFTQAEIAAIIGTDISEIAEQALDPSDEPEVAGASGGVDGWRTVYWTSAGTLTAPAAPASSSDLETAVIDSLDGPTPAASWDFVGSPEEGDGALTPPAGIYLIILFSSSGTNLLYCGLKGFGNYDLVRTLKRTAGEEDQVLIARCDGTTPLKGVFTVTANDASYSGFFGSTFVKLG